MADQRPLAFLKPDIINSTIAAKLGWVEKKDCANLCGGYYLNPPLFFSGLASNFMTIHFNSSELKSQGRSLLKGNITIYQAPNRQLMSDKAYIYRNTQKEFTELTLLGNVRLIETGKYIVGKKAHIKINSQQGDFYDTLYRINLDQTSYSPILANPNDSTNPATLTAYGKAKKIRQESKEKFVLEKATYTSCAPTTNSWRLKAKRIDLNHETGRGIAHDTFLTVKEIPIFYIPYLNFPIDKRRQTGFLYPTLSSSNNGGFSIGFPYYWNIAPAMDMTITPNYFSKRGLQFNHLFRYLTRTSHGEIHYSLLPDDAAFTSFRNTAIKDYANNPALNELLATSSMRQYFSWQHETRFNTNWHAAIDYTQAKDDYYFQDFNNIPTLTTTNQLLQQAKINYEDKNWAFQGMLQQFQTLHPVTLAPISNQYSYLPQLFFSTHIPQDTTGLVYEFNTEFTHFWRTMNPGELTAPVTGNRLIIQPNIRLPIQNTKSFFTPSIRLSLTQYSLANQPNGYSNNVFRAIPIVNIDSGLYLERKLNLFNTAFRQTLEPRLFYVYIPYHEQYQLPLFDSGLQIFNYDQLFRFNRFTGNDRIGDTHQITLGLSTRLVDSETGIEKFRASIGQIYYFRDRKVMLCGKKDCVDPVTTLGITASDTSSSPLALQFTYYLNNKWNSTANIAWDPHSHQTQNGSFNFQYIPNDSHIYNFSYNFIRYGDVLMNNSTDSKNNLNQLSFSFAIPIQSHWRTVAGWTYNLSHVHAQSLFYGAEYNTCCWAARLVAAHTFSGLNNNNTPIFNKVIYLQLLLKGMGNIGTNDPGLIMNAIPGYQDNFGKL
ncbi:MAG: LPS-assembly protein LptD [Legionellaceae bacterium]